MSINNSVYQQKPIEEEKDFFIGSKADLNIHFKQMYYLIKMN